VQAGAAIAALGSLLALVLGVSRTTFEMARDHHLPYVLAAVHPRFAVPHRAELVVGAVVVVLAAAVDIRGAIGFSSFGVLAYYAIANSAAWTLTPDEGRPPGIVPSIGLAGCLILAFALPLVSAITGAAVITLGVLIYAIRRAIAGGCRHANRGQWSPRTSRANSANAFRSSANARLPAFVAR
jgi:basic amino acid/polyamine antiporter, APA family